MDVKQLSQNNNIFKPAIVLLISQFIDCINQNSFAFFKSSFVIK